MKLVVTVDVEEDQWGITPPRQTTVRNVSRLPTLQTLFDEFGIVPTYLLTYPVASDSDAVGILRTIVDAGACEIGAHCHPWTTPPYDEEVNKYNSMLCNLSSALQFAKLEQLHKAIEDQFHTTPVAFRSGRWGFDAEVARNLMKLAYHIDTSITPYTSWARSSGPDFSNVSPRLFAFSQDPGTARHSKGGLVEVPVSIGYLYGDFRVCAKLCQWLRSGPLRGLKLAALLSRIQVLRKVWLSPEVETPSRMMQLVRQMRHQGYEVINLVFHSTALMKGCSPFIRTEMDEQLFLRNLRRFLGLVRAEGVVNARLSDAAKALCGPPVAAASSLRWQ